MKTLEQIAEELREKQRKQEEQDLAAYRHMFWRDANNSPTRPDAPLK
jgi:hypothetical protein